MSTDLAPPAEAAAPEVERSEREFASERFIARADPFQARAVALARTSRSLVVHGPPGTGKSQTITNIIGDHLARGERVLFVCDKRTALDVVQNRLDHIGLGRFFKINPASPASDAVFIVLGAALGAEYVSQFHGG